MEIFRNIDPIFLALIAGLFTWAMTAFGAGFVFFFKTVNKRVLNVMLGFAAGVMISASFWSLLLPAYEVSKETSEYAWFPLTVGFAFGGLFLLLADKIMPHIHINTNEREGIPTHFRRSVLLVLAITLHNIPEGLALGVAFGLIGSEPQAAAGAMALALGLGLQNIPEGAAVSIPLRKEGISRSKSFFMGQLSGIVEPIAAVFGAWFAIKMSALLPYALSFAAGAMIYVVAEELIPESQSEKHSHAATFGLMAGFILMTFLETAAG